MIFAFVIDNVAVCVGKDGVGRHLLGICNGVYSVNHFAWHQKDSEWVGDKLTASVDVVEFIGPLYVTGGSKNKCTGGSSQIGGIARDGILIYLCIRPKLGPAVFLVVMFLSSNNSSGTEGLGDTIFMWKSVYPKNAKRHQADKHSNGKPSEQEATLLHPNPLLDHSNTTFNLRCMLGGSNNIEINIPDETLKGNQIDCQALLS